MTPIEIDTLVADMEALARRLVGLSDKEYREVITSLAGRVSRHTTRFMEDVLKVRPLYRREV